MMIVLPPWLEIIGCVATLAVLLIGLRPPLCWLLGSLVWELLCVIALHVLLVLVGRCRGLLQAPGVGGVPRCGHLGTWQGRWANGYSSCIRYMYM